MKLKSIGSLLLGLFTLNACAEPQIVYVYQPMPNQQQGYYGQQQAGYYPPQTGYQNTNQMMYQQNGQMGTQPAMNGTGSNLPPTIQPGKTTTAPKTNQQASLPAATKPGTTTPSQPTATAPKTSGSMSTEEKILTKARTSFEAIQTLQATVTTFEKDFNGKDGTGQVKMFYKKPGQVKIEVLKSPDASQIGVKLAYSSGSSVKVRPTGALSLVSVDLAMSDNKLLSGRKYQLNQMDLSNTVQRLTAPGIKAKLMGQTQVSGANVVLVEIIPQNHFDSKITREVLGLDTSNFLPRIHEMYQGEQKVYSVQVPSITPNPPLPADAFEV